jgi:hypothetical protein
MKFGLSLPFSDARNAAELAHLAEEVGWDGFFVGDAIWCVDPIVALTAAAMTTSRIHLGIMVIPMPLRRPWKVASETAALDNLSGGRLILGLGTGAVWMGWEGFPDEVTDTRIRAEMLDEGIDILSLLYRRKQFDYDGKHDRLKLSLVDEKHYPPLPTQKPRIPLWVVGAWPRMKSMKRVLKCDGLLPAKINKEGKLVEVQPEDIREMKAYVDANRSLTTPFDIVVEGKTASLDQAQMRDKLHQWTDAGATWWTESLWGEPEDRILARIRRGPPSLD